MGGQRRTIEIEIDVHRAIERARSRARRERERHPAPRCSGPGGPAPSRRLRRRLAPPGRRGPSRARGLWSVEIGGRRIPAANAKQAYRLLLRELAAAHPHFLEAFAEEPGARAGSSPARRPALYGKSAHLARHAEPLVDGWYFDSNLSATHGRQARPDRGALVRPALRLGRAHPRHSAGDLKPQPPPARPRRAQGCAGRHAPGHGCGLRGRPHLRIASRRKSARPADGSAEPDRRHRMMVR